MCVYRAEQGKLPVSLLAWLPGPSCLPLLLLQCRVLSGLDGLTVNATHCLAAGVASRKMDWGS